MQNEKQLVRNLAGPITSQRRETWELRDGRVERDYVIFESADKRSQSIRSEALFARRAPAERRLSAHFRAFSSPILSVSDGLLCFSFFASSNDDVTQNRGALSRPRPQSQL